MSKKNIAQAIPLDDEILVSKIYIIRNQKVMLDRDLANLYGVETRTLKQAVRRNIKKLVRHSNMYRLFINLIGQAESFY